MAAPVAGGLFTARSWHRHDGTRKKRSGYPEDNPIEPAFWTRLIYGDAFGIVRMRLVGSGSRNTGITWVCREEMGILVSARDDLVDDATLADSFGRGSIASFIHVQGRTVTTRVLPGLVSVLY